MNTLKSAAKPAALRRAALRLAALAGGAACAAVGVAADAQAADLPVAPVYKAPVVAPFSWAGVYIGVHGGYGWGTHTSSYNGGVVTSSLDPKGGFGGGQIGYNTYLTGNWVLGSVLDVSAGDYDQSGPSIAPAPASATTSIDYFGTARARLGYAFDRWLLYATGGTAWAHNKFSETITGSGVEAFGRDQFHLGWTAGAGVEYALDRNWSIWGEYLYADLGQEQDSIPISGLRTTDLTLNLVRFGVNYRFDGSAPGAMAPAYPVKAQPPVASPWSGSFVGVHGGFGWGRTSVVQGNLPLDTSSLDPSGAFGGFHTGYNWRLAPSWVFGLESETSFGSLSQNGNSSPGAFPVDAKVDWFGSERVRLGVLASPDVLLYGTGGLAWAHYKFDETSLAGATLASFDQYRIGWAGGAGLEWAFAPLWSAKVEYLHSDLGSYQDVVFNVPRSASLTLDTVKLGLDYHGDLLATIFGH